MAQSSAPPPPPPTYLDSLSRSTSEQGKAALSEHLAHQLAEAEAAAAEEAKREAKEAEEAGLALAKQLAAEEEAAAVKAKELRDTQGANKRKAAVVKFVLCCASPLVWFVSCFRYQCSAI